jgi:hypothetical protein
VVADERVAAELTVTLSTRASILMGHYRTYPVQCPTQHHFVDQYHCRHRHGAVYNLPPNTGFATRWQFFPPHMQFLLMFSSQTVALQIAPLEGRQFAVSRSVTDHLLDCQLVSAERSFASFLL